MNATVLPDATDTRLTICSQHGCKRQTFIELDTSVLSALDTIFAASTPAAETERAAIARAIALLEQYVGHKTGTDRDLGGTFHGAFRNGQMDCIDEATNTTRYLQAFTRQGWLRWHDVVEPASRLPIPIAWWPHTTAVIRERSSGLEYAVDSWFEANGEPPYIVELTRWKHGWKPLEPRQ